MMKKLLLGVALFTLCFESQNATGQILKTTSTTYTTVVDTLDYFLNKQQYKTGVTLRDNFPFYKAPAAGTTLPYNHLTHCGSIFLNSDSISVTGLKAWAMFGTSYQTTIPVHLYLCNVDANNIPVMPPIDSVVIDIGSNAKFNPVALVGNLIHGPKKLNSNFSVLARNFSTRSGDTVLFMRTNAKNIGSNYPDYEKFGEGLGVVSKGTNHVFIKTTDFYIPKYFGGPGTDYEFCVAPIVELKLVAKQISPPEATTGVCVATTLSYTNASSPSFTNRQFNQNEFYRRWKPFIKQPLPYGFHPDSVITWVMGDDLRLDTVPYHWGRVQDRFLPYGSTVMVTGFDTASVDAHPFFGAFYAKYKKMCDTSTYGAHYTGVDSLRTLVSWCGVDPITTGIKENSLTNVKIAPNPSANGKTTISGLEGKNTITIYNMLGQVVLTDTTDKETYAVDLFKQPEGTYLLRVVDSSQRSKTVRIVNQKN